MAPWWGIVIGVVGLLIYWPGIIGAIPGLEENGNLKPLRSLDLRIGDFLHERLAVKPVPKNTPKICVVGITWEDRRKYGAMPWPRDLHARLVRQLDKAGARVIAFDIFFDAPTKLDPVFAKACEETGKVILPRYAKFPERVPISRPWRAKLLSPLEENMRVRRSDDGVFRWELEPATKTLYPSASGKGHINVFYDDDLVARRVPAAIGESGERSAYLPLGIVAGVARMGIRSNDARIEEREIDCGGMRIPLDDTGCVIVNYQPFQQWIDMKPMEMRAVEAGVSWLSEKRRSAPIKFYSYGDVLEGRVPAGAFSGSVVLVGQCDEESREDVHITPYGSQFGVFVQAMLLYETLTGQFLRPVSSWVVAAAIMILSLILGMACFRLRYPRSTYTFVAGGLLVSGLGLVVMLWTVGTLRRHGLVLDAVTPFMLVAGLNLFGGIAASMTRVSRESERRDRDFDLLLAAGQRHTESVEEEHRDYQVAGAAEMAISASHAVHAGEIVADTFWRAVPCEGCLLYVIDEENELSPGERVVRVGFEGGALGEQVTSMAGQLAREARGFGEPAIQSSTDPDWRHADKAPALRTVLAVPLIIRGQTLAVVLLCNKRVTTLSPERQFVESDMRLVAALRYQAAALLENARRYQVEYAMFDGFARSMAKAVDLRDKYTHGHSERVAQYSLEIARELGLSEAEQEIILRAATLHDVGKIGVNDAVLNKPGRLSDAEFELIRSHAAKGYAILKSAPSFEPLLPGIRHHHERYDGKGYPDRLAGEAIPLIARIIAVADTYDAMTSNRIYRKALSPEKARQELIAGAGTQFDPKMVSAFLRFLDKDKDSPAPQPELTQNVPQEGLFINPLARIPGYGVPFPGGARQV